MADERIVTSIVANSDFSNLIADVQRVSGSLFKLQQEFAGANRALAGQIGAANAMFNQNMLKTGQFSSHFVSLTSDVEKFGKNLDGGRLKLKDYFRVYQENVKTSGGLIRDLAKQQVQLQNAVLQPLGKNAQGLMQYNVHIPRGLDLTKNKTSLLKQELQIMNKVIQDGGIQLINWGKNTQWAGRQLTMGLTLPLVAFGKAAADAFKVADQELTRLTKVYGDVAGTSSQELSRIRKEVSATAKELSGALGVNFSETIALAADIAATGKTGNELLSSVSETTRLAVLGEVDRQEAMKATLAIQTAFKQNTEELAESINFLNAVENQTSTTLNDLVTAIPKAGPVIKSLGGDIQDLALYLTAMREGGINASESANALKSGLASLINPTKQTVGLMKGFGIDVLGMVKQNAGDTTSLLLDLQSALDQLDPLSKAQAIEQMFGKFQFARISALLNNLGKEGSQTLQVMELMGASVAELEAVAGRELSAVTESAAGKYKRAVEALKAELATTGDGFLNIATKLINVLNKILDFGAKLPDPIKKLMTFAGAFTAIIGPVIMLTGVLANFFGYIIKGLGHFRALFKGAEGFKLLTPEIIAARNASSMLSDEFYSDAKAADTLSLAIKRLNEDLKGLQLNAANATSSTNSLGATIATAAGTPIMRVGGALGTPRITDPNHPLVGPQTRAAAHLNPRDPNNPSSIFGLTLQPVPVNRRIGATPQILMSERLPDVPGLTNVGGISTGVVAAEHAKFAALMATLGVQTQQEIDALKKTIGLGGQVSRELLDTFDDILPITSRLTANAAAQSASIVAELKAGTINVQQARAQIIAVNAQLEAMMGADISAYAAGRGRTIDLTKAPLINQPVVDAAGKPNIRGAYRGGIFLDVMESLGRATGTKTFGGPYSIETTRPIGRNRGGSVPGYINGEYVYMTNGETVPGPNVNADVVPAMLTPGEFVLTRDVVQQQGSDAVEALHRGQAAIVPFGANMGGQVPGYNTGAFIRKMIPVDALAKMFPGRFKPGLTKPLYEPKGTAGVFGGSFNRGDGVAKRFNDILKARGKKPLKSNQITREKINALMSGEGVPPDILLLSMMSGSGARRTSTDEFLQAMVRSKLMNSTEAERLSNLIFEQYAMRLSKMDLINDRNNPLWNVSNLALSSQSPIVKEAWQRFSSTPGMLAGPSRGSLSYLDSFTLSNGTVVQFDPLKGSKIETFYHAGRPDPLKEILKSQGYNRGGRVAGYNRGGRVAGYNRGGRVPGYTGGGRVARNQNRAGGTVRSGRRFYGDFSRTPFGMMQSGLIPYPAGSSAVGNRFQFSPVAQPASPSMLGMMGFQAASFGGMYAGQSLGSRFGSGGAMAGSVLGSILPMMMMGGMGRGKDISALYDKSILSGTKFGQSMAGQAMQGGKLSSTLGRLALGLTKFNVAVAGIATAIGAGAFLFRRYQESQDRVANSFGMTAEQAKKAGLNYTNLSSKIKESIESAKALQERNQLVYQSLTMANTPLKLTIEQYKKLKQQVKDTMPDVVENINKMNRVEAKDYAVQLKTQFMAYGDTVEEATKKVYALFAVSDKKFMAGAAIAQKAFGDIKTSADAAASSINLYGKSIDVANSKGQARAADTALQAIDAAIQNTLKSSKDQMTYYDAMKKTLDEINLKTSKQVSLTKETIRGIAAQNPELASVLNTTDTIVSAWAKYQLLLKGINLDLSVLNANQAIAVNNAVQLVSQNVAASLIDTKGILRDENKLLKEKEAQYKKLETAIKGQSVKEQINARDAISAIDKKIKKINEEADARKKALQEEAQAEDIALRIQQKRLEYEKMVSAGDFGGAAEAQIELTRLQNEQQLTLTEQQIEERRLKDVGPLEREKERLQRNQEKLADAAALAGESMQTLGKQIAALKTTIADVTNSIFLIVLGRMFDPNFENTPAGKAAYAALSKLLKDTGNVPAGLESPESPSLDTSKGSPGASEVTTYQDQANKISPTALGQQMYDAVAKGIEKGLTNNPLVVKAQNVVIETGALAQSENKMGRSDLERILTQQGNSPEYTKKQLESKSLDPQVIASIIKYLKLDAKETFQYNGIVYNVERGYNAFLGPKGSIKRADGGPVSGPGTSTSDSIPAYLSDGEYVVRAAAVEHYGVDTMEAINAKRFKDGGMVKGKSGWLQNYAKKLSEMPAAEMFGTAALIRKLAGMGQDGDNLSAALLPLNFMGLGAGRGVLGGVAKAGAVASGASKATSASLASAKAIAKEKELMSKITVDDILNNLDEVGKLVAGFDNPIKGTAKWGPMSGKLEGDWAKFPEGVPDNIYNPPWGESRKFSFPGAGIKLSESTEFIPHSVYGGKTPEEYLRSLANSDGTFSLSKWSAASVHLESARSFNNPEIIGSLGSLLQATSNSIKYKSILNDLISQGKLPTGTTFKEFMRMLNISAASSVGGRSGDINEITRAANILYAQKYYGLGPEDTMRLYRTNVHGDRTGQPVGWHSLDREMAFSYGNTFSIKGRNMADVKVKDMPSPFSLSGYTDEFGQVLTPSTPVQFSKELSITPGWDKARGLPQFQRSFLGYQAAFRPRPFDENLLDKVPQETFALIRAKHGLEKGWLSHVLNENKETGLSKVNFKKLYDPYDSLYASKIIDAILDLESQTGIKILARKFADGGYIGIPKMAGGGYVNPAYSANMSMPSYYTGAKYVYDDTIAKLHKGEMVVPSGMNPNNPFATNTASGISINMPLTVNAAPGMDEDYLINKAAIKVQKAMETALTKVGTERNITRRYQ